MSTAAKTIAALLFVGLLGVVLTIPLRDSESRLQTPRVAAFPSPEASPSKASRRGPGGPLRTKRFAQRYPRSCLRPVPRSDGPGLIAVHHGRRVVVTDPSGERTATIQPLPRISPPVAWSPSGRYVAIGPQGLFWTAEGEQVIHMNGEFQHGIVQGRSGRWSWSPISDCAVEIEDQDGRLLLAHIDSRITLFGLELVRRDVESFAYSHDGRQLGLVIREDRVASLWIADLTRSRMDEVRRFQRATCCIALAGWSPDDRDLLYWAGSGASVMADGWPLEGIDAQGRVREYEPMITDPRYLEECGGRLLAVLGGGRGQLPEFATRRLSFIQPGRTPERLTPVSVVTHWPTCAPGGRLVAAIEARDTDSPGRLVVLDEAGRVRQRFEVMGATIPEWGPGGTGVLFAQRPSSGPCMLWFAPEGAGPRSTGLSVSCRRVYLPRMYDWSATPPDGLPPG